VPCPAPLQHKTIATHQSRIEPFGHTLKDSIIAESLVVNIQAVMLGNLSQCFPDFSNGKDIAIFTPLRKANQRLSHSTPLQHTVSSLSPGFLIRLKESAPLQWHTFSRATPN